MTEDFCYDKPSDWRYYQYCSQFCSDIGMPYKGARCCTEIDFNRVDDDKADDSDDEYPQLAFADDSDELMGECRGDCDSSSDCEEGLMCYQRSGYGAMPGCAGNPSWDTDYCLDPSRNFKELTFLGQDGPFGRCAGDCDDDSECAGNLICYQRSGEVNDVPGCPGRAVLDVDYCVSPPTPAPTSAPTQSPTAAPTSEPTHSPIATPLNRGDDGDCIECQDKPTPYMQSQGISCKDWSLTQYRCSGRSSYYSFWEAERFCELSCAEGGLPYPGPRCCGIDETERGTGNTGGSKQKRNNNRRRGRNLGKKDNPYDA